MQENTVAVVHIDLFRTSVVEEPKTFNNLHIEQVGLSETKTCRILHNSVQITEALMPLDHSEFNYRKQTVVIELL